MGALWFPSNTHTHTHIHTMSSGQLQVNVNELRSKLIENKQYPVYNYPDLYPHTTWIYETVGICKLPKTGKEVVIKIKSGLYEANMIYLAGECATPICGLLVNGPETMGIVMERCRPLNASGKSSKEKARFATAMYRLVERLHERKRIIHADIKADSFLVQPQGDLRLCDFGGSALGADPNGVTQWTMGRLSPYRYVYEKDEVMWGVEDDNYALAIAIWEMWVGRVPLWNLTQGSQEWERAVMSGNTINLTDIEDESTRVLVERLMGPALQRGGSILAARLQACSP